MHLLGSGLHTDGASVRDEFIPSAAHALEVILATETMDAHAPVDAFERFTNFVHAHTPKINPANGLPIRVDRLIANLLLFLIR